MAGSRVFISVGGTGQHVALALTRLVYMGVLKNDIRLIALDPDNQTDLPKKLMAPTPTLSGERHPLHNGRVEAPFDIETFGKKTFGELFVDSNHPDEQALFEALFDANEAKIPVHSGMYGTPCVGATVFGSGASSNRLTNLLKPLSEASEVYVCGSVVGGTGAGLIHKLVKQLSDNAKGKKGKVFGIFMLPWFDIPAGGGENSITNETLTRNQVNGVKYFYDHTLPLLNASLLVGAPGTTTTPVLKRVTVTMGELSERPSYLHVVAARALAEFQEAGTSNYDIKAYGYIHDTHNEGWLLDKHWFQGGPSIRQAARALRLQQILISFITNQVNKEKILAYYSAGLLGSIAQSSDAWRPLAESINAISEKSGRREVAERMLTRFEETLAEVRFCIDWISNIFPPGLLELENDLEMAELKAVSNKGAESTKHWEKLREIWGGQPLQANPTKAIGGADVADHHARLILQHGFRRARA